MTQNDVPQASSAPTCERKSFRFLWLVAGVILAACLGGFALYYCPIFQPMLPAAPVSPDITKLEHRLDILEAKINGLTEIPVVTPSPAVTSGKDDSGTLTETVKNLQTQLEQLQSKKTETQNTQRQVSTTLAFWEMRDAAHAGHNFSIQLAALRQAAGEDNGVKKQAAKLETYAAAGVPTYEQLRVALEKEQAKIGDVPDSNSPEWMERVKKIMRPLISVHPLHNPQFAALEQALEIGDTQKALENFNALPDETKTKLSDWQSKLQARTNVDDTLHELATHFSASDMGDKQ